MCMYYNVQKLYVHRTICIHNRRSINVILTLVVLYNEKISTKISTPHLNRFYLWAQSFRNLCIHRRALLYMSILHHIITPIRANQKSLGWQKKFFFSSPVYDNFFSSSNFSFFTGFVGIRMKICMFFMVFQHKSE